MNEVKNKEQEHDLEKVKEEFALWRKTKNKHSKIPETLWDEAVRLCETHSLRRVCHTLKLCPQTLRRRVNCKNQLMENSGIAIEMERPDGTKVRMNLKGQLNPHQIEIAKSFWQAQ